MATLFWTDNPLFRFKRGCSFRETSWALAIVLSTWHTKESRLSMYIPNNLILSTQSMTFPPNSTERSEMSDLLLVKIIHSDFLALTWKSLNLFYKKNSQLLSNFCQLADVKKISLIKSQNRSSFATLSLSTLS